MVLVYLLILAVGSVLALFRLRSHAPVYMNVLALCFSLTLCVELISKYALAMNHHPNSWLLNLYLPVEYILFTLFYYFRFTQQQFRRLILLASALLLVFAFIDFEWIQEAGKLNTYTILASGTLILCWVFLYFRQLLRQKEYINLLREPMFWISTGLLFFYAGNVFVAGTLNYFINTDMQIAGLLLQMIKLLNILMFSLFIVATLCQPRRKFL